MSAMDDRRDGFESKFAHDEELKFKAVARRNKLLGLWAAGKMEHADPDAYAKEVVLADFEEVGDEDVFRMIRADFDARNVAISDEDIRSKMFELLAKAVEQVQSE